MMFIVAVGGRGGPLTGMVAPVGVACAMLAHTVTAALGLSALFLTLPTLYEALHWAGAAYLLFLAVKAFRGAVTNLLNPKVNLFNVSEALSTIG